MMHQVPSPPLTFLHQCLLTCTCSVHYIAYSLKQHTMLSIWLNLRYVQLYLRKLYILPCMVKLVLLMPRDGKHFIVFKLAFIPVLVTELDICKEINYMVSNLLWCKSHFSVFLLSCKGFRSRKLPLHCTCVMNTHWLNEVAAF